MRSLVVTQNMSLDGSIEFLGDWFDPTDQDEDLAGLMREYTSREEAMLLGRRTFEDFRGFWPLQTDDTTGNTEALDRVEKYVVTSTMTDPEWQHSTLLGEDWPDRVRDLKAGGDGDICLTGSISLCHAVIGAGLVDEYRLLVHPVVQGRGRRLFPDGFEASGLRTLETRVFDDGVVLLRYSAR